MQGRGAWQGLHLHTVLLWDPTSCPQLDSQLAPLGLPSSWGEYSLDELSFTDILESKT